MNIVSSPGKRKRAAKALFVLGCAALLTLTACTSSGGTAASSSPAVSPSPSGTSSPTPSGPAPSGPTPGGLAAEARTAAGKMKNYGYKIELKQKMTGEAEASNSTVSVTMEGRAELGPLKLDQQVKSDEDGEVYSMRAILVPDAYYMYNEDFEEWSKMSKEQTAEVVKTLSSFQVDPARSMEDVELLGSGLKVDKQGDSVTLTYEGNGPEAVAFHDKVLESTLGLSSMDPKVRSSIKLGSLKVTVSLDPEHRWPVSYRIDSVMTMEYEAGKPSKLEQTLSGIYEKVNGSAGVVVPDEAKNAPELDPPVTEEDLAEDMSL